jgi:hypothetical protein
MNLQFPRRLPPGPTVGFCVFLASCQLVAAGSASDRDPGVERWRAEARDRRAALEYERRAFPLDRIPDGARARALAQTQQAEAQAALGATKDLSTYLWSSLGPAPIRYPATNMFPEASGRVTTIAVDPSKPSTHWLIGAAQGGIWETTDSGSTWLPRTDDQASLAMGAIAFSVNNPSRVYAGTGEPNNSADSYAGAGLLVSYNGGTNWQMLNSSFAQTAFSGLRVDRSDDNNLAVATVRGVGGGPTRPPNAPARGLFVSSNGGTNFTRILTGEVSALEADPYQFRNQYAAIGDVYGSPTNGLYRTTNAWATSEPITGPWTDYNDPTNLGRIVMAVAPSSSQTLYVAVAYNIDIGGLLGVWRTDNAWTGTPVWTYLSTPSNGSFLWYYFALSVDPVDETQLYLAEQNLWRYSGSWNSLGTYTHADNHAMAWIPWSSSNSRMLLGNDGGIWYGSAPVSSTWASLNRGGLSIAQIYKGSVHPKPNNALLLAGTQDNGTAAYGGSLAWQHILTGDGGDSAISLAKPDTDWAASWETYGTDVNIYRTQDAGTNMDQVSDGIDWTTAPFYVHFEKSPRIDDLFIAGTIRLWRCTNFFSGTTPTWFSNSPVMLGTTGAPVTITALAFAPSDTNGLIYAFGTHDGQLRVTTNGGNSWSDLDPTNGVPGRHISGLAFSPADPSVLYVAVAGFDEGTPGHPGHLFKTANALDAIPGWSDISPPVNLPHNCLVIDPNNHDRVFVGTDIGVWSTTTGGSPWTHLGPGVGMPNVAVFDLRMNSVGQVTAFTHGRGAFTYAPGIPIIVVAGPVHPIDIACLTCPPVSWLNPGDLVEIEFPLLNVLPFDTVNLVATMLPSALVTPVRGTQAYGVVPGQGPAVSRRFSFRAGAPGAGNTKDLGGCGDIVEVVLQLQDQGMDLGRVTIPFRLSMPRHPLAEDFETVRVPELPPGWHSVPIGSAPPWTATTNSPPNVVGPGDPGEVPDAPGTGGSPPNISLFVPDVPGFGESVLISAPCMIVTPQAQLYFRQAFSVSNAYDGCILEIAVGTQPFQDILRAGGSFLLNGYNQTLADNNPLGPRPGWSGNSGGWLPVTVNLPPTAAGQTIQLRWHFANSRGLPGGMWFIDSVVVTEALCLPPVSNPVLVNPTLTRGLFTSSIDTVPGRTYVVEYQTNLTDTAWQFLQRITGDGNRQSVSVPVDSASQSFFRFHLE